MQHPKLLEELELMSSSMMWVMFVEEFLNVSKLAPLLLDFWDIFSAIVSNQERY